MIYILFLTTPTYQTVLATALLFFGLTAGLLMGTIWSRIKKDKEKLNTEVLRERYGEWLSEMVISEEPVATLDEVMVMANEVERTIFLEELLGLHKNLSGEMAIKLEKLYLIYGLAIGSLQKLQHKSWYVRMAGLHEIKQMRFKEALPKIVPLTKDKNKQVQKEAALLHADLSGNPMVLLQHVAGKLSRWHQMHIAKMLGEKEDDEIPPLRNWLETDNPSVMVFVTQMMLAFNQIDDHECLLPLLTCEDDKVKKEAIHNLARWRIYGVLPTLFDMYADESISEKVKLEILNAIGVIGDETHFEFLETQMRLQNYDINLAAARALKAISSKGEQRLTVIYKNAQPRLQSIIKHAMDKRI